LKPEDRLLLEKGLILPVMEVFYSIQGEGFNTGKAAWFIRIGGCDVGCHWCDVKESWDASIHPLTTVDDILSKAETFHSKSVVITGGEPLMYNLDPLCAALKQTGHTIFLETSGAYPVSGKFDWICLSPKINLPARSDLLLLADELKVIIHQQSDFSWAEDHSKLVREKCLLFLQPEWSQYKIILPKIVEYIMKHPRWMISLQAHKFMNIP
jgi:7-carboxy-7-deazaguanine synthase